MNEYQLHPLYPPGTYMEGYQGKVNQGGTIAYLDRGVYLIFDIEEVLDNYLIRLGSFTISANPPHSSVPIINELEQHITISQFVDPDMIRNEIEYNGPPLSFPHDDWDYCPRCGNELISWWQYCAHCGLELANGE